MIRRMIEIFGIRFDHVFWRKFIDLDLREETRMMHYYE